MSGAEPCRKFNSRRSGNPVYRRTGKPTFNSTPICGPKPCSIPGQIRNASGTCVCPPGKEELGGKCVAFCPSDRIRGPSGNCVCPSGQEEIKGKCVSFCPSDKTRNTSGNCVCPPGQEEVKGKCVSFCPSDKIRGPSGTCVCPPGQEEVKGKCVSFCPSDKTRNASGNCVCPPGQEEVKGKCLPKCSAGTHREGDKCVSDILPCPTPGPPRQANGKCGCPEGKEWIPALNACKDKCLLNQERDGATHECKCKDGFIKTSNGNCILEPTCNPGFVIKKGKCVPVGKLLRALIVKSVYTDDGIKLDKQMYRDLFGKEIPNKKIDTKEEEPNSQISISNIYNDPEYQYSNSNQTQISKGYMTKFIGQDKTPVIGGTGAKGNTELNNISNGINVELNMATFGENIFNLDTRDERAKRQFVAYFFNIALILYSLYYRENDIIPSEKPPVKIDKAKQKISLTKVYKTIVKPFIKNLDLSPFIPYSNSSDKNENENIQVFINYYNSSNQDTSSSIDSTKRVNSLGLVQTAGRRKTQKRKHSKITKTRKYKIRKSSKTIKFKKQKKYTRRK